MECLRGLMVVSTMETGKKGSSTVMECLRGPMVANITGNGTTAKKMAKEFLLGLTGENMRDMECILRLMVLRTMNGIWTN